MKKYHVIGIMGTPKETVAELVRRISELYPNSKKPRFVEGGDLWLKKLRAEPGKFYIVRDSLPVLNGLGVPIVDAHEVYNGHWVRIPIPEAVMVRFLRGLLTIPRPKFSMVTRNLVKVAQRREP